MQMKKFKGKIGKYSKMNQRQRSKAFIKRDKEERKMNRAYIEAYAADGYAVERNLVDKLKYKKGGKTRMQLIDRESRMDECRNTCPNDHYGW
jgi:hypothetical protein